MNEITMNDLIGLVPYAPIIAVVITVLVVMIAITIKRSHMVTGTITVVGLNIALVTFCLLYTSPSPRDRQKSRMPSSA